MVVKAKDAPHHCPVCGYLYYPRHTVKFDDLSGVMLTQVDENVCIKGTAEWVIAYYHHSSVESGKAFNVAEASPV